MLLVEAFVGVGLSGSSVMAQTIVATDARAADIDPRVVQALFARPVTVVIKKLSLKQAIDAIASDAGIAVFYDSDLLGAETRRVTARFEKTPLRQAFDQLLTGTALTTIPVGAAKVAIVQASHIHRADDGGISGVVTDAKGKRKLAGVVITLDDSVARARTDDAGEFHFAHVAAGTHRLTARLIGFNRQMKIVTVADDATASVSFALTTTVNTLDQVVVTATGEQRYRELGHVVATINADSLVKNAPITSVAELLTARVPGLQVITSNGGMAGGDVALRLRGQTTTTLDQSPVVIVDGVRYRSNNSVVDANGGFGATAYEDYRPFQAEQRSPLNDLNVNDIEKVEVVKGPSASTLYGPDAANGVILITTKRAKAGKTEWHVYAHPRLQDISGSRDIRPPTGYWGWGHDPNTGQTVQYSCTLVAQYAYNACIQDSVGIAPSAATLPGLQVISKTRPQWQYGADVGGGSESLRYFLSGGYDSQVGSLQVPPLAAKVLERELGTARLSDALREPNVQRTYSVHSNVSFNPNVRTSLVLSSIYTQSLQRSMDASIYRQLGSMGSGGVLPPGCSQSDSTRYCVSPDYTDGGAYLRTAEQHSQRLTGNVTGTYRPFEWLNLNSTIGLDLGGSIDRGLVPQGSTDPNFPGQVEDYRRDNTGRTATIGATALAHPGRFSFRSSVGSQYTYNHLDGLNAMGLYLAPGSSSIATATYQNIRQLWNETVTLGSYGEEEIGLNDRLFLTGSLRLDGSTSFGDSYHARPYPKVGLSWIASEEPFLPKIPGVDELRFRYSFGAASRYPTSAMRLGSIGSNPYHFPNGQIYNIYDRGMLANPDLRPERSREAEYGTDATLFGGSTNVGVTWWRRRTTDQLQQLRDPQGIPARWGNVGTVSASGVEATVDARLFETRMARGSLQFTYSYNTSKLLSLGSEVPVSNGGGDEYRVGYPLGSTFDNPIIGVADTVGGVADGIVFPNEIIRDSVTRFLGVFYPPHTFTLTPMVSLFGDRVRLSTMFDRQTGFIVQNAQDPSAFSKALLVKGYPLLQQARYLDYHGFYEPGDFTRWREFTVSTDLPVRFMHAVFMKRGTINLAVRNLALWTRYNGSDPESTPGAGGRGHSSNIVGATGIPLARSWSISFDFTP